MADPKSAKYSVFVTGGSGFLGRNLIPFLIKKGWTIIACARSSKSIKAVQNLGAIPVKCDLSNPNCIEIISKAMKQHKCHFCFHCAAFVDSWGIYEDALSINTYGTRYIAQACENSNIFRLIHISTEQVLSSPECIMDNINEKAKYPDKPFGIYGETKKLAEIEALKANHRNQSNLQVIILRPRFIWGCDDGTVLPAILDKVNNGSFAWLDGGLYQTSIVHVINVCHAMYLTAVWGIKNVGDIDNTDIDIGGNIYFVTDEKNVKFKHFVRDMLKCVTNDQITRKQHLDKQGKFNIESINKTMSFNLLYYVAAGLEYLFCCGQSKCCNNFCKLCCNCQNCCKPPINRVDLLVGGRKCTVDGSKIRKQLNYQPIVGIKDGLIDMAKRNGKSDKEIAKICWESV